MSRIPPRARVVFALPIWTVIGLALATMRAGAAPASLSVDLTDAADHLAHVRLVLPVSPGSLTLVYPKWIPGEHGPTGPIDDLVALRFTAGGRAIPWERDSVDMYAFHLSIPSGVTTLEANYDFLSALEEAGFSSAASFTPNLAMLSWNQVVLYPRGGDPDDLSYAASLRLPEGWRFGTALAVARQTGNEVRFDPVSLTRLVDSPVLAGSHFRALPLTPGRTPSHEIDMVSDSEVGLAIKPETERAYRRLVEEELAVFGGAHHYRQYRFLVTLSDHVAHFGLEHHESSDDRVSERTWTDDDLRRAAAGLLSHEMFHSWNGKYRRPADLATPDYQTPMRTDLLWVYEGLTNYYGWVLAARSGLLTPKESRDNLAITASYLDRRAGRSWRPLKDTAVAAQLLYNAPTQWASWRRGTDFYDEGTLIWLEADVTIRRLTQGRRSLDDFCRRFHGAPSGPPQVVPYTFADVTRTLNEVAPSDWKGFFEARLERTGGKAPLGGLEGSGWKLEYGDSSSDMLAAYESSNKRFDLRSSIGATIGTKEGDFRDVIPGLPAAKAGIAPGMELVAVNGRKWNRDVLMDALKATKNGGPLELLVSNNEFFSTHKLDYRGGAHNPMLMRESVKPDVLSEILRAHAGAPSAMNPMNP